MGDGLFAIMPALNHQFKCWTPPAGVISSQSLKTFARTPVFALDFYFPLTAATWKSFTSEHINDRFALTRYGFLLAVTNGETCSWLPLITAANLLAFYGTLVFSSFTVWEENGTMNDVFIIKAVII